MKYKYNGQWLTIPTGGGSGLPDPSAADKMLISNDSLEWEEIDKEDVGTPTWTGTQAEYDAAESDIADGTIVNITDDDGNMVGARTTEIYSTDEIVVGRWIDGKPIYRKVITLTFSTTARMQNTDLYTSLAIALDMPYIDQAWFIRDKSFFTLDKARSFMYGSIEKVSGGAELYLITLYSRTNALGTIVLEYTKTTD